MKKFLNSKSRPQLFLTAALIATIWAVAITIVIVDRRQRVEASAKWAGELTSFFEDHTHEILRYADAYVQATRREYLSGGIDAVDQFLDAVSRDQTIVSHLTIIDRTGVPIFISDHKVKPGVTAGDRPYFRYQRDHSGDDLYFSLPHKGRNTGILTIRLVRRITEADGTFAGVVFAAMPVEQFTHFFSALKLGPNSSATLVGLDKRIRARSSYGRLGPGQDISASQLWTRVKDSPTGIYLQTSVVDDVTRYYSYRLMSDYPLVAAIGIAVDDVSSAGAFAGLTYALATLMSVVIGSMMFVMYRRAAHARDLEREVEVRRKAEDEANRANGIKSTFLATMSHEIRTPINAIMGLLELIEGADIPERQKRQANAARSSARDLLKQLTNVLDVSRLEARSLEISIAPEPLAPLVSSLRELLEATVIRASKDLVVSVTVDKELPEIVNIDRRRVHQVVINLIDNAVRFTRIGSIDINFCAGTHRGEESLNVSVTDTGVGIAEEDQQRVFERFGQLDGAITREAGGTGLGLSISKELARLMGGDLLLCSRRGEGSTFILVLPLTTGVFP